MQILSLDDHLAVLELLNLIVQRAGYEHIYTTDGQEALSILRNEPIDLFTQDIMRPGMDGEEFYRLMKSEPPLRDIPVLFITCQTREQECIASLRAAHADGYITKPFRPQELLDAIAVTLQAHSKSPPTEADRLRAQSKREETLRRRVQLLEEIVAGLPNVRMNGQTVIIDGYYGRYKVSLVNDGVVRLPDRRMCIVPQSHSTRLPNARLQFEDTDASTERLVSTILMLSADQSICDESILKQCQGEL